MKEVGRPRKIRLFRKDDYTNRKGENVTYPTFGVLLPKELVAWQDRNVQFWKSGTCLLLQKVK